MTLGARGCTTAARGSSMLEILVAMGLFAVTGSACLSVIYGTSVRNEWNEELGLAHKAAQQVMEDLLAMPFDTMQAQNNLAFGVPALGTQKNVGRVQIVPLSNSLVEIHVRVDHEMIHVDLVTRRNR